MDNTDNIILSCTNLSKHYKNNSNMIPVLNGINLAFQQGSINLIYGKSGSGKTTLLNLLASLDIPTSGEIIYNNSYNYKNLDEKNLAHLRGNYFGFVFQAYNLIPNISVKENIKCPSYINKKKIDENYYNFLIDTLGIRKLEKKIANKLSGGEQQRVAIARAMILKPQIIFADEPTGNLDSENTKLITELFLKLNKEYNTTFIIVTHEENLIPSCDLVIQMKDGKVNA